LGKFNLPRKLNSDYGRTVIMIVHDLNDAAQYAAHLVALQMASYSPRVSPSTLLIPPLIKAVLASR